MKKTSLLNFAVLLAGFAAGGLAHGLEQPKLTIEEFRAKLKKDETPLPAGGQISTGSVVLSTLRATAAVLTGWFTVVHWPKVSQAVTSTVGLASVAQK